MRFLSGRDRRRTVAHEAPARECADAREASLGLNLGEFLRFGRGEEKSGGRQKNALLADVFEAITGAIFLDGGLEAATDFVCYALRDELEGADPLTAAKADYKTMLQERLQAERRPAPRYAVIETLGPPHQRIFHVEVSWDGGSYPGRRPLDQNRGSGGGESRAWRNELGRIGGRNRCNPR